MDWAVLSGIKINIFFIQRLFLYIQFHRFDQCCVLKTISKCIFGWESIVKRHRWACTSLTLSDPVSVV